MVICVLPQLDADLVHRPSDRPPQLTGPLEDVAEDVAVERPQMLQVIVTRQATPFQVDQP
jgi:hypothetical protein